MSWTTVQRESSGNKNLNTMDLVHFPLTIQQKQEQKAAAEKE